VKELNTTNPQKAHVTDTCNNLSIGGRGGGRETCGRRGGMICFFIEA